MIENVMKVLVGKILSVSAVVLLAAFSSSAAALKPLPDPAVDAADSARGKQTAVLAGGCFWCTEAVFEEVKGVTKVISGYAGGTREQAHYEIVGAGKTDHAESIQITYDPSKISYGQLLKVFFGAAHDPTQLNRQGPDYGRQYRSEIFYSDDEQKKVAEAYIQQLTEAHVFDHPIVTKVEPLKAFYPAEGYHQDYVRNNPTNPYVMVNSRPKIEKLRKLFPDLLKKK
jgi:peptide-methionine (S)-S-oxide reductase